MKRIIGYTSFFIIWDLVIKMLLGSNDYLECIEFSFVCLKKIDSPNVSQRIVSLALLVALIASSAHHESKLKGLHYLTEARIVFSNKSKIKHLTTQKLKDISSISVAKLIADVSLCFWFDKNYIGIVLMLNILFFLFISILFEVNGILCVLGIKQKFTVLIVLAFSLFIPNIVLIGNSWLSLFVIATKEYKANYIGEMGLKAIVVIILFFIYKRQSLHREQV